jgi:putative Mg2+ transporter-C (MgtC) family protein
MSAIAFALQLALALLLGAAIGAERQWRQRTAGLRTNALVSSGAAMFVLGGRLMGAPTDNVLRVAAQVVSGVGFLGGGLIVREGLSVRGLNTAATLWCSAAVGMLCGVGYPHAAALCVAAVMSANVLLRPLARLLERSVPLDRDETGVYLCTVGCRGADDGHLRSLLLAAAASSGLSTRALHSEDVDPAGRAEIRATLVGQGPQDLALERVVSRLSREPGVKAVSWELVGTVHQCAGEPCDRQQPARTRVMPVARTHRLNLAARKASPSVFRSGTDPLGVSVAFAGSDRRAPKEGAAASSR